MAGVTFSAQWPDLAESDIYGAAHTPGTAGPEKNRAGQQCNLRKVLNFPNNPIFPASKRPSTSPPEN